MTRLNLLEPVMHDTKGKKKIGCMIFKRFNEGYLRRFSGQSPCALPSGPPNEMPKWDFGWASISNIKF